MSVTCTSHRQPGYVALGRARGHKTDMTHMDMTENKAPTPIHASYAESKGVTQSQTAQTQSQSTIDLNQTQSTTPVRTGADMHAKKHLDNKTQIQNSTSVHVRDKCTDEHVKVELAVNSHKRVVVEIDKREVWSYARCRCICACMHVCVCVHVLFVCVYGMHAYIYIRTETCREWDGRGRLSGGGDILKVLVYVYLCFKPAYMYT